MGRFLLACRGCDVGGYGAWLGEGLPAEAVLTVIFFWPGGCQRKGLTLSFAAPICVKHWLEVPRDVLASALSQSLHSSTGSTKKPCP